MEHNIIEGAFSYTKEGLLGDFTKWVLLVVLAVVQGITFCIVPLLNGYFVRVFSGADPLPEINEWGKLFIDGWKYNIIVLLYMIPVIVIAVVFGLFAILPGIMALATDGSKAGMLGITGIISGLLITFVVLVIISLFLIMGLVRFGKTNKIGEAFNFGALNQQVSNGVGWLGYIGYIILLWIFALIFMAILVAINFMPFIGLIISIFLLPAWYVFTAKYMTNIYDTGESA